MASVMGKQTVLSAFARVGEVLGSGDDLQLVIVGGAAGLLTDQFSAATTTADVDGIRFRPAEAIHLIQEAAQRVARENDLPVAWLNDEAGIRVVLPIDWESRMILVGKFGRLRVEAIARIDLIASKFLAHRPRDLAHLREMNVTSAERLIVREFLSTLRSNVSSTDTEFRGAIEVAQVYVAEWNDKS